MSRDVIKRDFIVTTQFVDKTVIGFYRESRPKLAELARKRELRRSGRSRGVVSISVQAWSNALRRPVGPVTTYRI